MILATWRVKAISRAAAGPSVLESCWAAREGWEAGIQTESHASRILIGSMLGGMALVVPPEVLPM